MTIKTYEELIKLPTFEERFRYLKLGGEVGKKTFGTDRVFNQQFYRSHEWRSLRNYIITRDGACDLGISTRPFLDGQRIIIHHMNPIELKDIANHTDYLMNENYLISVSFEIHQAIHYGDEKLLGIEDPIIRKPNDTCPWR